MGKDWFQTYMEVAVAILVTLLVGFAIMVVIIICKTEIKFEDIQTEDYIVSSGETLWDIAEENKKEGTDTREYVYNLRKLNNIDCIIYEGQVIKIIK